VLWLLDADADAVDDGKAALQIATNSSKRSMAQASRPMGRHACIMCA
jgi:hypothetical protein